MEESSPARLYCLLVGAVLVVAGIIGFFYEASFATGDSIRSDDVFGILAVNGWHNLVHIAIGAVLLLAAGIGREGRRTPGGRPLHRPLRPRFHRHQQQRDRIRRRERPLLKLVPVNNEDNVLHLILGITGVIAAFATRPAVGPLPRLSLVEPVPDLVRQIRDLVREPESRDGRLLPRRRSSTRTRPPPRFRRRRSRPRGAPSCAGPEGAELGFGELLRPGRELLGGGLGDRAQGLLEPAREVLGRLDRPQRGAQQALDVARRLSRHWRSSPLRAA
jgi:hypothetical protein